MSRRKGTVLLALVVGLALGASRPAAGDDEPAAGGERLGEAEARSILASSTRCAPRAVDLAAKLGPKHTLHDAEQTPGGAGLALLLLAYLRHVEEDDLRPLSKTWHEVLRAMLPARVLTGDPVGVDLVVSLLREPHLTSVSIEQEGDLAQGAVEFRAPDAYEGRFEHAARRIDGTWRITELRLPSSKIRVTFANEAWHLELPDWLRSVNPHRGRLLALPRVGMVGKDPDPVELDLPVIVISVTREGTIRTDRHWSGLGLAALRNWFRMRTSDPRLRTPNRFSAVPLLLDVDEATPWVLCQWLLSIGADKHARIRSVFFGATAEATGEAGALACFQTGALEGVPVDSERGVGERPRYVVELRPTYGEPDTLGSLWAALSEIRPGRRRAATFRLSVPPGESGHLPAGVVLQVLGLLQQAEVGRLELVGAEPPAEALWNVDAISALVERGRAAQAKAAFYVDGHRVRRVAAGPPDGKRVGRYVGFGYPPSRWDTKPDEPAGGGPGAPRLVDVEADAR